MMGSTVSAESQVSSITVKSVGLSSRLLTVKVTVKVLSARVAPEKEIGGTTGAPYSTTTVTLVAGHEIVVVPSEPRMVSTAAAIVYIRIEKVAHKT